MFWPLVTQMFPVTPYQLKKKQPGDDEDIRERKGCIYEGEGERWLSYYRDLIKGLGRCD